MTKDYCKHLLEAEMGLEKRKTIQLKAYLPIIGSLIYINTRLTTIQHDAFELKYGKILNLLFIKVHSEAITALIQFSILH